MSTPCQIEFRGGNERRTVYRHWDGYPSAVIPDLLAFLEWSQRHDVEYEAANFIFWSGMDERSVQLGFGICENDELHGDVEYLYVVEQARIRVYGVEHTEDGPRRGSLMQEIPLFSSLASHTPMELPRVKIKSVWYFRDDRLEEFRRVDNPHERITFDELFAA